MSDLALPLPVPNRPAPVPLPGKSSSVPRQTTVVVIPTDEAVMSLIDALLERSGASQTEVAQRLGIRLQSLNQYRTLRRKRPSIQWLTKLAAACGARILIEFPAR